MNRFEEFVVNLFEKPVSYWFKKKPHPTQADVDVRTPSAIDAIKALEHFGRALRGTEQPNPKKEKIVSPIVAEIRITAGDFRGQTVALNAEKAALIVSEHAFAADNRKQFQQEEYFVGGKHAYRRAYKAGEFENTGTGVFQALASATGAVLDSYRAAAKAEVESKAKVAASYGMTVAQLDSLVAAAKSVR